MIQDIRLQHYRSYDDMSFEFGEGVNIIVGPNGSGKTNLLEAILVLATGSSYRANDADIVQFKADWARLDAHLDDGNVRTVKLQLTPKQEKTYEINDKIYRRLIQQHTLPVVLFEPNHLGLLSGSPEGRRSYLDDILEQIQPGYSSFRRNYKRILAQRNALLKHRGHTVSQTELFPWNLRLAELGAVIARHREELTARIQKELGPLYGKLSHASATVSVRYVSKFPIDRYETYLLEKLESSIKDDALRGFTAYGPHREDLLVEFDARDAAEVASRGETRTVVLALKIIELQLLEEARSKTPVLLLDDVFSELDGSRRRALTEYLQRYQTFLTTTDADIVVKHFTDSTIIPLGTNNS